MLDWVLRQAQDLGEGGGAKRSMFGLWRPSRRGVVLAGCLAAFVLLLYGLWVQSPFYFPALVCAVREGDHQEMRLLIQQGADIERRTTVFGADNLTGLTPLMWAAYDRDPQAMKILVDAGADVNAVEPRFRRNALQLIFYGQMSSYVDMKRPVAPCVQVLLAAGIRTDVGFPGNDTPLDLAVVAGEAASVRALLTGIGKSGAGVPASPDLLLLALRNPVPEVFEALIQHGADVNTRLADGSTILEYARKSGVSPEVLAVLERAAVR